MKLISIAVGGSSLDRYKSLIVCIDALQQHGLVGTDSSQWRVFVLLDPLYRDWVIPFLRERGCYYKVIDQDVPPYFYSLVRFFVQDPSFVAHVFGGMDNLPTPSLVVDQFLCLDAHYNYSKPVVDKLLLALQHWDVTGQPYAAQMYKGVKSNKRTFYAGTFAGRRTARWSLPQYGMQNNASLFVEHIAKGIGRSLNDVLAVRGVDEYFLTWYLFNINMYYPGDGVYAWKINAPERLLDSQHLSSLHSAFAAVYSASPALSARTITSRSASKAWNTTPLYRNAVEEAAVFQVPPFYVDLGKNKELVVKQATHGWGVFTDDDPSQPTTIKKGTTLGEYKGETLSVAQIEARYPGNMLGEYVIMNTREARDARYLHQSNWTRYINDPRGNTHNPIPGANVAVNDRDFRLVALRDIGPGEELLMDYGPNYFVGSGMVRTMHTHGNFD